MKCVCVGVQCGSAREQVHPAEAGDGDSGGQEHGFPGSASTGADADDGCVRQLCDPEGGRGVDEEGRGSGLTAIGMGFCVI